MAKRRVILALAVCSSLAAFAGQTLPQTRSPNRTAEPTGAGAARVGGKAVEGLNVCWSSITYKKTLHNPAVPPEDRGSTAPESLSLSCQIEMSDARRLLGIATDPAVEKITDSQGKNVEMGQGQSQPAGRYFEDPLMKRWLAFSQNTARSAGGAGDNARRIAPQLDLDAGLRERVGGKIGLLKGHYIGLLAESIEYIDVPFRPDDHWVRLTDDVEIRVVKALNVPSMHHYEIEQRPEIALSSDKVYVGDPLPYRLVVGRQIIAHNNTGVSGGSGEGRIGGRGSGLGRAEGIRFVIAVNPAHVRIPFEFRHVPLSAPAEPTPSRMGASKRTARLPVMEHLRSRALTGKRYEADKMRKQAKLASQVKHGRYYDVDWHSITYTLNLYNPAVLEKDYAQKLSVLCDAKILDPDLVLGTCDAPIIERITDGSGRDTDISRAEPRPDRMCYRSPGYRPNRTVTPPSTLAQLEAKARLAMGLPLLARHRPKRGSELQPVRMVIQLDPGLMGQGQREIGRIEGYFHALTTESYKHVEVPFKPSNKWVRLTSDVEIQVAKAWHDGVKYRCDIKERSKAQIRPGRLHVDDPLPDGIVVEQRFTGPDVPPKRRPIVGGGRSLPRRAGGNGSVGYTVQNIDCRIETIDYLIAVNPAHHRIPFEFEHIPLPNP